jgi:hypothetical protein
MPTEAAKEEDGVATEQRDNGTTSTAAAADVVKQEADLGQVIVQRVGVITGSVQYGYVSTGTGKCRYCIIV